MPADSCAGAGSGIVDGVMKPLVAVLALAIVGAPLVSTAAPCHPGGAHDGDCCLRHGEQPVETTHTAGTVAAPGTAAETPTLDTAVAGTGSGALAAADGVATVGLAVPDDRGRSQDADSCSHDCHLITPAVAAATSQRPVPLILGAVAVSDGQPQARSSRIEHVPLIP